MGYVSIINSGIGQEKKDNQILVYFKSGIERIAPNNEGVKVNSLGILQLLNAYGLSALNIANTFPKFNEADTVIHSEIKMNDDFSPEEHKQINWAKIFTITVPNISIKSKLIERLNELPEVLYAESNGDISNNVIPADGRFNQQWGLRNLTVPNADIHAEPAWNIFTGNPNAIIAIIDNGVDNLHNDLNAKMIGGDNGFIIETDPLIGQFSHGTHVAGIAAAVTNNNNNNGVAGVDWMARIHRKNIFDGNGDPDIVQSILDAMNFNTNVWTFNNSWSTRNTDGSPGRYSITIRSAFAEVYKNNRVQCVAMGNHQIAFPNAVGFPAGFNSGIITVGATDINDNIANFSAQGTHIDVSAPGVNVLSTNFNNAYIALSGTSMATPHVAGLASLLKGFNTNLANDDIEQIIKLTSDDRGAAGFDNAFGSGRINALRALQSLQAPNTIQQLNSTGGTIFSTSGSTTKVFLGVPGLADAAYIVKRSEVRKAITFPAMCNIVGVWGRGVGTTGYREEQGRCFGEGICEVVPGTLTANGCTLRTWIYEVWSLGGQYIGFFPRFAQNVIFQYTVLGVPAPSAILGPSIVCTTSTPFTLPNLPPGSTVSWTVYPSGIASLSCTSCTQTTLNKISNGTVALSAHITNPCGLNITINKGQIKIGGYSSGDYPITGPSSACKNQTLYFMTKQLPGATSYTWSWPGDWTYLYGQGTNSIALMTGTNTGYGPVGVKVASTCDAGGSPALLFVTVLDCGGLMFSMSPNPAGGTVNIELKNSSQEEKIVSVPSNPRTIKEVSLYDQSGNLKKKWKVNSNTSSYQINISEFSSGVYFLEVSNGTSKQRQQILIQK